MNSTVKKMNNRGKHPNSLANLEKGKKFQKGQIANPNGRPRNECSITNRQREMLPEICPYDPKGRTWLDWLSERGMALAGENATYYREFMDRHEGKVLQPLGNEDGSPLIIQVNVNSNNTKEDITSVIARLSAN